MKAVLAREADLARRERASTPASVQGPASASKTATTASPAGVGAQANSSQPDSAFGSPVAVLASSDEKTGTAAAASLVGGSGAPKGPQPPEKDGVAPAKGPSPSPSGIAAVMAAVWGASTAAAAAVLGTVSTPTRATAAVPTDVGTGTKVETSNTIFYLTFSVHSIS